jgi:hypothetical protein
MRTLIAVAAAAAAGLSPAAIAQTDVQLRNVCKDFVQRSLHDPSGAYLNWTAGKSSSIGDNLWVVQFPGAAKNQFGAVAPATFECVIQYTHPDQFRAVKVRACGPAGCK